MSKKSKRKARVSAAPAPSGESGPRRRSYYAAALTALVLLAASAAATRYDAVRRAVGMGPLLVTPAQGNANLPLSKEYVYAGGRLVATEEPGDAPAPPDNLRILNNGVMHPFKATLTWDDNSVNETGFKIEKNGAQIAQVGPNVTSYTIYGSCGDTYRVRATNGLGDSAYSNEAYACMDVTTVGPTGLLATATAATSVWLTWEAPAGAVDHYEVERWGGPSEGFSLVSTSTATSVADSVNPDKAYLYRVRAVFTGGSTSGYSNADLATAVAFTDSQLQGITIKATHLTELRRAVNAVRMLAGKGAATWTYPDPVSTPASQRRAIYLEDVTDLRAMLDEAMGALGLPTGYPVSPALARKAVVSAQHFEQIRARVR
jgi:hypothetical protein